ncbi:MAG: hypothetical protein ACRCSG_02540 [Cellulosilyticaceae bacterium]
MRHEFKKVSRIIDELTTFFLEHEAKEVDFKISVKKDREIINIEASPINNMRKIIEELQHVLSCPRESEIEEYYWELAGECDYSADSTELSLIGMMIDSANIDYDEEHISLELVRRKG